MIDALAARLADLAALNQTTHYGALARDLPRHYRIDGEWPDKRQILDYSSLPARRDTDGVSRKPAYG